MKKVPIDSADITLLVVSDLHCNSTLGLAPPQGARLPDGQRILPSRAQLWQWECWKEVVRQAGVARKKAGGRLVVIMNGDMVEGLDHHGTVEVMSKVEESQQYITEEVLGPMLDLSPDRLLVVRGTPAHVGHGGSSEEILARWVKAERDPDTECWSRYHLLTRLHGVLIDAQHHGKGLPRDPRNTRAGAIRLAYKIREVCDEKNLEPPALVFRSHLHRHADSENAHPKTRAIFTPAFQLKTSFGHKVAADEIADIGGIIVNIPKEGRYSVETILFTPSRPSIV